MAYVVCSVILLAIMAALAEGMRYLRHEWPASAYVAFCLFVVAAMYWLARTIDRHEASESEEDFYRSDRH
jgi:Kef-type K+ transport system membrane component KefB